MDPATGEKDWLPDGWSSDLQTWPVELGDRPARADANGARRSQRPRYAPTLDVFDRGDRDVARDRLAGPAGPGEPATVTASGRTAGSTSRC